LCIPSEYVIIAGIEPASSVYIVCLIPDMYVDILEEELRKSATFPNLTCSGICDVEIDGNKYYLPGKIPVHMRTETK